MEKTREIFANSKMPIVRRKAIILCVATA
ncbi:uncharacterized protein METZ01_LOCUS448792, partial [marine metagenome]